MPEWRKIFEAENSDFGGEAQVPWKCVLQLKWMPQVLCIWEPETTNPKPTEADHDQSSLTPQGLGIPLRAFRCGKPPERIVAFSDKWFLLPKAGPRGDCDFGIRVFKAGYGNDAVDLCRESGNCELGKLRSVKCHSDPDSAAFWAAVLAQHFY
jgi:hypothetical protein